MQKTLIDSIDSFFTELNEEGIEYAILEKNQPNFINKTEIDIILNSKKDLFNLKKRYYHIYNQHGLFFVLLKKDLKEYKRIHINGVFKTLNRIKLRDKYFINYNHYYKSKNESNFRHVFFLIKRIIYGKGIIISLLGPDGAGKSTIAKLLSKQFKGYRLKSKMIYFGNINPTKITIVNYLLNYAHKYFLFMKSYYYAKMGYLVILDRYAYNNTLDYYNNQPKLKKVINKIIYYYLFPKPDLFILLETKPEIYFKRKKEHNIKKLTNMLNSYKKILQNTKHVIINTTNNNPEEVIKLITPTIFRKHLKGINSKK